MHVIDFLKCNSNHNMHKLQCRECNTHDIQQDRSKWSYKTRIHLWFLTYFLVVSNKIETIFQTGSWICSAWSKFRNLIMARMTDIPSPIFDHFRTSCSLPNCTRNICTALGDARVTLILWGWQKNFDPY